MLKTILSVTGKPGLFKLISSGKNMVIVESLIDKKKMPIYARDKVVSLGDIAMYTIDDEVPLREVLTLIKQKENGAKASIAGSAKPEELQKYLVSILPNYDKERVYNADIKKLINWYNLLIESDIDFEKAEGGEGSDTEALGEQEATADKKETKPKAKKESKPKSAVAPKQAAKATGAKGAKASTRTMNRKAQ